MSVDIKRAILHHGSTSDSSPPRDGNLSKFVKTWTGNEVKRVHLLT